LPKKDIHPPYKDITAVCSCGNTWETKSTLTKEKMNLDVCSKCHPFYTGQSRVMDTAGRVEKFNARFKGFKRK
jgi:large subunit ribosomal protein L31